MEIPSIWVRQPVSGAGVGLCYAVQCPPSDKTTRNSCLRSSEFRRHSCFTTGDWTCLEKYFSIDQLAFVGWTFGFAINILQILPCSYILDSLRGNKNLIRPVIHSLRRPVSSAVSLRSPALRRLHKCMPHQFLTRPRNQGTVRSYS